MKKRLMISLIPFISFGVSIYLYSNIKVLNNNMDLNTYNNLIKSNVFQDSLFSYQVIDDNTAAIIGPADGVHEYQSITFPNTVKNGNSTYKVTKIADYAFDRTKCSAVIKGSIFFGDNISFIGERSFYKQSIYGKIIFPKQMNSIGDESFKYINYDRLGNIELIELPERINGSLGRRCFANIWDKVLNLNLPEYIEDEYSGHQAFSYTNIININFPNSLTNSITSYMFYVSSMNYEKDTFWLPNVENIPDSSFRGNNFHTKLVLGRRLKGIGSEAFFDGNLASKDNLLYGTLFINDGLKLYPHIKYFGNSNIDFSSIIIKKDRRDINDHLSVFNIQDTKREDIGNGYVQIFKDNNMTIPTIQSVSIEGSASVVDKLNLKSSYTFTNEYYADSFINFKWERFHGDEWQTIGTNDYYLEQDIDSSWNGDKIRLTAEYNGVVVISPEIIISTKQPSELKSVSINGLKDIYFVPDKLTLSPNLIFTNNNYDNKDIKYYWEISNQSGVLKYYSYFNDLDINLNDTQFNNCTVKLTVTYKDVSLSTKKTLKVEKFVSTIVSSSLEGVKSQYLLGDYIDCRLEYQTNANPENLEPTKYIWEKYKDNHWQSLSDDTKNIHVKVDDSWRNSKLRLRFIYNDNEYYTPEYSINVVDSIAPISIKKVEITGLKKDYKLYDNLLLQAQVILSNGSVNTSEIGYKWQISKQQNVKEQHWDTISISKTLKIEKLDKSYTGCSIRFIPTLNNVDDTKQIVNIVSNFQFIGDEQLPQVKDESSNWTTLIIIISCAIILLIIIILTIIFLVKRKKDDEYENKFNSIRQQNSNYYYPPNRYQHYPNKVHNHALPSNSLPRNTVPKNNIRRLPSNSQSYINNNPRNKTKY